MGGREERNKGRNEARKRGPGEDGREERYRGRNEGRERAPGEDGRMGGREERKK